jgi:hypothetical protein
MARTSFYLGGAEPFRPTTLCFTIIHNDIDTQTGKNSIQEFVRELKKKVPEENGIKYYVCVDMENYTIIEPIYHKMTDLELDKELQDEAFVCVGFSPELPTLSKSIQELRKSIDKLKKAKYEVDDEIVFEGVFECHLYDT